MKESSAEITTTQSDSTSTTAERFDPGEYRFAAIEAKWQEYWEKEQTFKVGAPGEKKFYCLDMFPYPSGSGLHLGHPVGYSATDIYSRYKRMRGFSVLHPMGWDAFGLPAEQHAMNTGEHPSLITEQNCDRFRSQMKKIGLSFDWTREVYTCREDYYKWTQWIFLKIYNSYFDDATAKARPIEELPIPAEVSSAGEKAVAQYRDKHRLAYYADAMVNWCPALGTVLANEEVIDGKSERGGHEVIRKPMKQWMLRITKYAERLVSELDEIDWPESIKEQQRNWVGKKRGAEVSFRVLGLHEAQGQHHVVAFTTRPDTLCGVTFFVLAPEHALVDQITTEAQRERVAKYKEEAKRLSDFSRTLENRKKTGVFTGGFVENPLTGAQVPVYVADYVLSSVGTGAVMGVPAHDERDFEFARMFNLAVVPVLKPTAGSEKLVQAVLEGEQPWCEPGVMIETKYPIAAELGMVGKSNEEALEIVIRWLEENDKGRAVVNYKLRDWLFSRQRYWGEPIPIIHWEDGTVTPLAEDELPLTLPQIAEFKPSDTGESPLARAVDWVAVVDKKTGKKGRRETNTMPQWAGSCWYYLRFIDPENSKKAWSPELEKGWMSVDLYVGGAEHAVLHLLYARFWHKVLFDLGYVSTREPFKKLLNQGMLLAQAYKDSRGVLIPVDEVTEQSDGSVLHNKSGEKLEKIVAKMSKSLRNVVTPDEIIEKYGADTLRLYIMFMGPLDCSRIYDAKAILGIHRFLRRAWTFVTGGKAEGVRDVVALTQEPEAVTRAIHGAIKKVGEEYEQLHFNTSISTLMECLNAITDQPVSRESLQSFVLLLAPLAPHLSEELWERLGNRDGVSYQPFPSFDPARLELSNTTVVIQVDGKKRAVLDVSVKIHEDELKALAIAQLAGSDFAIAASDKFIVVYKPGTKVPKLLNVIRSKG